MSLPLHPPAQVFSSRHFPTWLLLAGSAGAVNALGFLACARFVTHVTGTVSNMGMDVGNKLSLALDYAVVLGCFVGGAAMSSALIEGRHHRGKKPLYAVPLLLAATILAVVGTAGAYGLFGVFGSSVEELHDFVFLSALSFAMGLQNAAVSTSTGNMVRTTHMTGPATDLGVHLATSAYAAGDTRKNAMRHALLRFGKIGAFTMGAAAGAGLARAYQYGGLIAPAVVVLLATFLSFVKVPKLASAPVDAPPRSRQVGDACASRPGT